MRRWYAERNRGNRLGTPPTHFYPQPLFEGFVLQVAPGNDIRAVDRPVEEKLGSGWTVRGFGGGPTADVEAMSALPDGVVTFLFTDIEGSTRRWDRFPQQMMQALSRHNDLLGAVVKEYRGYVFKTVGDAFCVAFSDSASACEAAMAAQRRLQVEDWGEVGPLQVRMALHSGPAEEVDGDYFGPTVNRVARLASTGHGGQILLTQATYDLARGQLPEAVQVRDFGERRLKDLTRPEHILQLVLPDLRRDFPPLRTLDPVPNNLPVQLTSFIGREKLVRSTADALRRSAGQVVTLVGPGGAGKTRIALQAAAELVDEFEDGVFLVRLSAVRDPEFVAPALAQTLGVKEVPGCSVPDVLKAYLRDKHFLLVIDNFEQVAAAAPLLNDLLVACAGLRILVTSRASLKVYGEQLFQVPPMALPDMAEFSPAESEALRKYEAIDLFVERVRAIKPNFVLGRNEAAVVVEICRQVDGLPLAIELAAARTRVLSLSTIRSRLGRALSLLTSGPRDLPARQQTLRNTIEWSYDLLGQEERQFVRRASVFVGGFTLSSAQAICGGSGENPLRPATGNPGADIPDLLTSLVDQSLLRAEESLGEPRFDMLSTIREYMLERLAESGEYEESRYRHAAYFLELAETAAPFIRSGVRRAWLEHLQVEHSNLLAALEWCQSEEGVQDTGVQLAGALHWFWYFEGYLTEGRDWLGRVLATDAGRKTTPEVARALDAAGRLAMLHDDRRSAESWLEKALDLWRTLRDRQGLAYSLSNLGMARVYWNESTDGVDMLREAVRVFGQVGDQWGEAFALDLLAEAHVLLGELDEGAKCYQASLALHRRMADNWGIGAELGELARLDTRRGCFQEAQAKLGEALSSGRLAQDRWNTAHCLRSLGDVAYCLGEMRDAQARYEEAAEQYRVLGDRMRMAACIRSLGHVARIEGDTESARALYLHSLGIASELGALPTLAWCFTAIAGLLRDRGDFVCAARLLGASDTLARASGAFMPAADKARYGEDLQAVRSALGEERFVHLFAEGQTLGREQAAEEARRATDLPCGGGPHGRAGLCTPGGHLTDRETEVLSLAASGLTDAEIARETGLGSCAVRAFVYSICAKIGVKLRNEAVSYALKRDLGQRYTAVAGGDKRHSPGSRMDPTDSAGIATP